MSKTVSVDVVVRLVVDEEYYLGLIREHETTYKAADVPDQLVDEFQGLLDYEVNNRDKLDVAYTATIVKEKQ